VQGNPRKSKEKSLHFLGFLWWNPDFSTRYSGKKKKIALRSDPPIELCKTAAALPFRINDPIGSDPVSRNTHSTHSGF
jgi:hypothetical protein